MSNPINTKTKLTYKHIILVALILTSVASLSILQLSTKKIKVVVMTEPILVGDRITYEEFYSKFKEVEISEKYLKDSGRYYIHSLDDIKVNIGNYSTISLDSGMLVPVGSFKTIVQRNNTRK